MKFDVNKLNESLEFLIKHKKHWEFHKGFLEDFLSDGSLKDRVFDDPEISALYIKKFHVDGYLDAHLEAVNENLIRNRYILNTIGQVFYHNGGYVNENALDEYRQKTANQLVLATWALVVFAFFSAWYYLVELGCFYGWWCCCQ